MVFLPFAYVSADFNNAQLTISKYRCQLESLLEFMVDSGASLVHLCNVGGDGAEQPVNTLVQEVALNTSVT